jgi:hypothetical protein
VRSLQPERALRLLDSLDGIAFAMRLACAGYWGRRLRLLVVAALVAGMALIAGLPVL